MKKLSSLSFVFFLCLAAAAQQRPHYTQYMLNNYVLNPAISGIENYTDVKLSARDQWVGLNGAPQTFYLTVHAPIGKTDYKTTATSYEVPGENPRGKAYWESYTASAPHHGVGLSLISDKTGNFTRTTAAISYAYHIGLSPRTNLALGVAPGLSRISRNLSATDFGGGVTVDPAQANSGVIARLRPDLSAGLWLYSADYFVGLAAQQIIPQKVSFVDDAAYNQGRLIPHLFLTAGYRFLLNEDMNALPSFLLKYVSPNNPQVDVNLKLQYHDLFWMGASVRINEGYQGMLGINVANAFNVGYAYDFTQTKLNTTSRGTHEILIGFLLGNRYADTCPRSVW
ncbi:PorP/SprF family type IX secretion system membrane protein [Flavisolibacter nicotianae]|uniref:PorP/SprF family type IX secretion system membrane protein n=1 Tax=Flavisolibacter nicotianae TaxID=2364882 RepID=UPI000EAE2849|nr:type IX secretion system membrane protein PorP/SprF [Flavisolibacter nicotianae]